MNELRPRFIPDRTPENLDDDPFRVSPVAARIAAVIREIDPPFTISLSGSWGVGKTTLVEEVQRKLKGFRIVSIDTWTEDLPQLRWKMAVELGGALAADADDESREAARKATAERLDKILRTSLAADDDPTLTFPAFRGLITRANAAKLPAALVGGALVGLVVLTMLAMQSGWEVASVLLAIVTALATFLVVGSGQFVSVRASSRSLAPASEAMTLASEMRRLIRKSDADKRPVLLVVDNLDRLTGTQAMEVLADIRAFVDDDKSRCIFLIPIDRDAFARSVGELVGTAQSARDYLEKFFNLDVVLTKPAGLELRTWTRGLLAYLFPGHADDHAPVAELVAAAAAGSPRAAKRIVNGMSARYWLVDADVRNAISLPQLAVLEALISQFPHAASATARDARRLMTARERLRSVTTVEQKNDAIADLLPPPDPKDEMTEVRTTSLRRFLDFAEGVPLDIDTIQTVLALRSDPSMVGVPNGAAVKAAIRDGDPEDLAEALKDHSPDERALALERGIAIARDDVDSGFHQGAITAINAMAPLADDPSLRPALRAIATTALVASKSYVLRGLPPLTVGLVFEDHGTSAGLDEISSRAVAELAESQAEPRSGLVHVLTAGARRLAVADLQKAQKALAQLPDAEAAPLFQPPSPLLVPGPVADGIVGRLAGWTPAVSDADIQLAVSHLERAVEADVVPPDHLDPIAAAIPAQLPAVDGSATSGLDQVLNLLRLAPPGPNIDALATALATWPADPGLGLEWAARLRFSEAVHPQITTSARTFVSNQPAATIGDRLPRMRQALRRASADLWGPLAERWADGQGPDFLTLVLEDPGPEAWEAIRAHLAAAPMPRFAILFAEACVALVDAGTPIAGLDLVRDVLVSRSTEIPATQVPVVAPGLAALERGGSSLAPVVDAVAARIGVCAVGEIVEWTAAAEAVASAAPSEADRLAQAVASHSRAVGAADLSRVPWLLDSGADRDQVKDAVAAEVRSTRRSYDSLAADLTAIRGKMRKVWPIRLAIVERVQASGPSPDPRALLVEAREWNKVPADQRPAYDTALGAIAAFGGLDDVVGPLW